MKSIDSILEEVESYQPRYVTVTGGEPLAQKSCIELLGRLSDRGYEVSLETSGALDVALVDPRVVKIVDLKTPGSGECDRNRYENIPLLLPHDQVKFVICDEADYQWAKEQVQEHDLTSRCEILFSPSFEQLSAGQLADWILADRLAVRLQIQLHKYLWGDEKGR